MIKQVVIISNNFFSNNAGFSRIIEYAKGLVYGREEEVVVYYFSLEGNFLDSFYQPFADRQIYIERIENKNKIKNYYKNRYWGFKSRRIKFLQICKFVRKSKKQSVFLLYPFFNTWYEEKWYMKYLKQTGYRFFSERNERALGIFYNSEYPHGICKKLIFLFIRVFEFLNALLQDKLVKDYDGNIVISETFRNWILKRNTNFILIPSLCSIDSIVQKMTKECRPLKLKIAYAGTIGHKKDNLTCIFKALSILTHEYHFYDFQFSLYGFFNQKYKYEFENILASYLISDKVFLHEAVNGKDLRKILNSQDCLVCMRDNNLQNRFGQSTKLAEYMGTGNIVITTDVGDNSKYIENGINGFIIGNTSEQLAQILYKISQMSENDRKEIGKNAFITANKYFNISLYAEMLQNFLDGQNLYE